MLIRKPDGVRSSEITDENDHVRRREFMKVIGGAAMVLGAAPLLQACSGEPPVNDFAAAGGAAVPAGQSPIANYKSKVMSVDEKVNTFEEITSYNNFYEFGMGKSDPQRYAGKLKTSPWTVKVDGLCNKPADYHSKT